MLVTSDDLLAAVDPVAAVRAAERGGATSVQLRLKAAAPREVARLARLLLAQLAIPLLINDRPDIARAVGAAGVHLGADDVPPRVARRVLGTAAWIGASVGSEAEAMLGGDADYWGVGPWRATTTKPDAGAALGAAGFGALVRRAGAPPAVAIGGVEPRDVPAVLAAGGAGVAVASGILAAGDIEAAARRYAAARA